jgi:predicted  nucleic acid-binding Zn-ribbon protein
VTTPCRCKHCRLDDIDGRLADLEKGQASALAALSDVKDKLEALTMSVAQDFETLRTQIDGATTAVAQRIDRLTAQIKNGMTDDEVSSLKAEFGAISERLTGLGQDPANPVPEEPQAQPAQAAAPKKHGKA